MANRVTTAEVLEVVTDDVPSTVDLTPQITAANALINAQAIMLSSLSADLLKYCELYLSASNALLTYKFSTSEAATPVSVSYSDKEDGFYDMAAMFDSTGTLKALKNTKYKAFWNIY